MIGAAILAAGQAKRMGQPKQLLLLDGKPLVWHVASQACRAGLQQVVVVSGAYAPEVTQALTGLPVQIVHNPDWAAGQATSVAAGVKALGPVKAVLFMLADQPLVNAMLINELISAYRQGGASIIAPRCQGQPGNPVMFELAVWRQALLRLSGDEGARRILRDNSSCVRYVEVGDPEVFLDADTPEDFQKISRIWQSKKTNSRKKQ
jgi:molybdenum cofactor cytidylyltransferase